MIAFRKVGKASPGRVHLVEYERGALSRSPENLVWTFGSTEKMLHLAWNEGGPSITYRWRPPEPRE
jgi:hypothetical protein